MPKLTPEEIGARREALAFDRAFDEAIRENARRDNLKKSQAGLLARTDGRIFGDPRLVRTILLATATDPAGVEEIEAQVSSLQTLEAPEPPPGVQIAGPTSHLPTIHRQRNLVPLAEDQARAIDEGWDDRTEQRLNHQEQAMEVFLFWYAETGLWNQSAYRAGQSATWFKEAAKHSERFNMAVAQAKTDYAEKIQAAVRSRALDGVVKPVFGKDGLIGYTVEYSERLLELEAKASNPERYREDRGNSFPADVRFGVMVVPGIIASPAEWEEKYGALSKGMPDPQLPADPAYTVGGDRALTKVTRPVKPRGGGTPDR